MRNKVLDEFIVNRLQRDDDMLFTKLIDLYRKYTSVMVEDYEGFVNSPNEFRGFLFDNIELINKYYTRYTHDHLVNKLDNFIDSLSYNIDSKEQKTFANIVDKAISDKSISHVLEVGPGYMPTSSIILGRDRHVTAMDKDYWISNECLKRLNVEGVRDYFTKSTSVMDYDMVVGRCPCSAIDTIVHLCSKNNKPYVIETCDCEMPTVEQFYRKWNIPSSTNEDKNIGWYGWMDMLPALDPNIASYGDMVYHVEDNDGLTRYLQARAEKLKAEKKENSKENISCTTVVMNVSMADPRLADTSDEKEID